MSAASRLRSFFRFWFPVLLLTFAIVAIPAITLWPSDFEDLWRSLLIQMIGVVTAIGLFAWFLFFSGLPGRYRIVGLILVGMMIGGGALLVERIEFTGNITPIFHLRFATPQDVLLEAHRSHATANPETVSKALAEAVAKHPFPAYRGEKRDGVVTGPPLQTDWKSAPPLPLWRQPVGGGYASISIQGSLAVTVEQRRNHEVIVAYDALSGIEKWKYEYPALFTETMGGDGPRATPTIAEGFVYSLGATGVLVCLEAATGKEVWKVNVLESTSDPNLTWGMSGSPLVYDNFVVVNPGSQSPSASGHALVAFDRKSGELAWSAGTHKAGYASPMLATIGGVRQIVLFDGEGVGGHDASTGGDLWRHPWVTQEGINVAQPVVLDGDRIFVSSGYGVGCAMLHIKQENGTWSTSELWNNKAMRCRFTSPVLHSGYLYGLDEGILVCVDAENGKRKWKQGRFGHGQMLLQDNILIILSEQGELALVKASPDGYDEIARIPAIEGKTWNYPALSAGLVFVRNHQEMACYDLRQSKEL